MTTRKPFGGRPRLAPDDTSTDVHLKLPSKLYDKVYLAASANRVTVPELIRMAIRHTLASGSSRV